MPPPGVVRIVGGEWRGRRISVAAAPKLRPTPSRMRETLFNWWRDHTSGASMLDLFAGTGVLGFEAASRGAAHVSMVEKQSSLCRQLWTQVDSFGASGRIKVHCADALKWLRMVPENCFDLVCLDPPFANVEDISTCCQLLLGRGWLKQGSLVYAESPSPLQVPDGFTMLRQSRTGQVHGSMWQCAAKVSSLNGSGGK
ncbi:MAG: 16S rRNA (guanine(966)-N(2))-methyltransferase RsmD [Candidatus Porifericomitaceae bacterium WSBS_2022_MAG_OTU9]